MSSRFNHCLTQIHVRDSDGLSLSNIAGSNSRQNRLFGSISLHLSLERLGSQSGAGFSLLSDHPVLSIHRFDRGGCLLGLSVFNYRIIDTTSTGRLPDLRFSEIGRLPAPRGVAICLDVAAMVVVDDATGDSLFCLRDLDGDRHSARPVRNGGSDNLNRYSYDDISLFPFLVCRLDFVDSRDFASRIDEVISRSNSISLDLRFY